LEILNTPETEIAPQADNRLEQLTIADGIFALILLVAGLFRLVDLGKIPLSGSEAELALSVWRFWQPGSELLTVSSPAYFTLTSLLTQIFGFSDSTMRLVPALLRRGPWRQI
jgi:predicted membrane-bound mannosyltransferase